MIFPLKNNKHPLFFHAILVFLLYVIWPAYAFSVELPPNGRELTIITVAQTTDTKTHSARDEVVTNINQRGNNNVYNNNTGSGTLIINEESASQYSIINLSGDPVYFGSNLHLKVYLQGKGKFDNNGCTWAVRPLSLLTHPPTDSCEINIPIRKASDNLFDDIAANMSINVEIENDNERYFAKSFVTVMREAPQSPGIAKRLPQLSEADIRLRAISQGDGFFAVKLLYPNMDGMLAIAQLSTDGIDYEDFIGSEEIERPDDGRIYLKFRSLLDSRVEGPFVVNLDVH